MSVLVSAPDLTIHVGDVRDVLRGLSDGSVDCCVTSPPYWGLRDYGTGSWDGGDADCDHAGPPKASDASGLKNDGRPLDRVSQNDYERAATVPFRDVCGKCGARRVDQQLGLEATPDQYVNTMVAVFREVRRVLADHGTLWLNLGDSYAHSLRRRIIESMGPDKPNDHARHVPGGWSDCGHDDYRPGVVLDPFLGSGTTALVARNHGRSCVGIELNPAYAALAARRLQQLSLLAVSV